MKFNNKVVLITGGSSGIGKACALELAKRGASVVISARGKERLINTESEFRNNGFNVIAVLADVSKENDCKRLIEITIKHYQKIDILINNAGISMRAMFSEIDMSVFEKIMQINFMGTVYCTKYALPHIIKQKGTIVGVSSISGYAPLPARTAYCASKYAMHGFLETLRIENKRNNLHVLIATPGFTSSNIRNVALNKIGEPQGESPRTESKMMTPEEVACKIARAIKKKKRSLILTKQGKLVVLLKRLSPALVDFLTYKHMAKEPNSPFK